MSAIVVDPVPNCWADPAVVSCILAPPRLPEERSYRRLRATRRGSRSRYWPHPGLFHVRHEEGLIDSSLEDRHAQSHTFLDDLATLHAGFASELRGREMDCHQYESSW